MDRNPEPATRSPAAGPHEMLHAEEALGTLRSSIALLEQKKLLRSVQELKLQLAKELIKLEVWDDALRVLRPLWQGMSYRNEGWWDIVEEVGWTLRMVARRTGDRGTIIAVDWELMNSTFTPRPGWQYDIMQALEGLDPMASMSVVVIRDQDIHSFLSATFAFEHAEGKVGESCTSQLTVISQALTASATVTMAEIRIFFEGSMRPVTLRHATVTGIEESRPDGTFYSRVVLREPVTDQEGKTASKDPRSTALLGEANLSFPPGKGRVFEFVSPLRESGEARAISATFVLSSKLFDLEYIISFDRMIMPDVWWCQKLGRKRLVRVDPHAMNVLPKPPKMDLRFVALQDQYYTNESIRLQLDISNGEDDESVAKLVVQISGDQPPPFILGLAQSAEDDDPDTAEIGTQYVELGSIASAGSISAMIEIPPVMLSAVYDVTVELSYHLVSDMETPISKTTTIRLMVVSPFEANYDFSPRLDLTPWPSFFSHDEAQRSIDDNIASPPQATGLAQKWCLTARYASFAAEELTIEDVEISIFSLNGGVACNAMKSDSSDDPLPHKIQPNSMSERHFSVLTRKLSLDDRRSASLDLLLVIKWRRLSATSEPDKTVNTTHLPIPRLLVASSEPRVLASVTYSSVPTSLSPSQLGSQLPISTLPLLTLSYTIENPSLHFLTFGIVMNPSEHFAFSGIKQGTVQLMPLSRRTVRFRLLPLIDVSGGEGSADGNGKGQWVKVNFVVRDRYFQKILKPVATEAIRTDKEGVLIWVPASVSSAVEAEKE